MRFCLVYPYATWLVGKSCGGAEKQVGLLAQHLARRGNDVTFVALEWRGQDEEMGGVLVRPRLGCGQGHTVAARRNAQAPQPEAGSPTGQRGPVLCAGRAGRLALGDRRRSRGGCPCVAGPLQ